MFVGWLHGGFAHYTVVSLGRYELSLAINRDAFMYLYSHKVYRSWEGVLVTERRVAGGILIFYHSANLRILPREDPTLFLCAPKLAKERV